VVVDALLVAATLGTRVTVTALVGAVPAEVGAAEVTEELAASGAVDAAADAGVASEVNEVDACRELHEVAIKTVTISATAVVRMELTLPFGLMGRRRITHAR
jgi:hypothetical protein